MKRKATKRCAGCVRLQAQVTALQAEGRSLRALVAQLQEDIARLRKDSRTSSKPPSSDIVKPPPPPAPEGQSQRRLGAQPGHPRQERPLLPADQINGGVHCHVPELCPDCGRGLQPTQVVGRVVQQMDIQTVPVVIAEHRSLAGYCPRCRQLHYGPLPSGIAKGGLLGPRLTAFIAYLKGVCHASYSTIRKLLRDVVQVTVSRGLLAKVIAKVSQALDAPYQTLLAALPTEPHLNVDETGHKDQGEPWWTWCFRAELYTVFKIANRSGDVLIDVLGREFAGVLGSDYFSAVSVKSCARGPWAQPPQVSRSSVRGTGRPGRCPRGVCYCDAINWCWARLPEAAAGARPAVWRGPRRCHSG